MSLHFDQEPMDPGDLEPKHAVFLCHSGAQKGFVEQLDKDLRSVDQNPFFDKNRESLPIGDHFPTRIFQVIERCNVGVVFLSEEFFMRSYWPMFELVKMVECGKKLMPIYLGISPGDLSNEEKVGKWKSKWEAWSKENKRIDVAKWESTLRFLRPLSGLVYNHVVGEVKFREEIVKEVCKIVPSFYAWDDSHVQGMSRICKVIKERISKTKVSKTGFQVLGLYGVGGIGKTTACKCLCTNLALEFDGRVCHIQFGDGTSELDRVREVLKQLRGTNNEFMKDKNLDECWNRLKGQLRAKKVVLALDNVSVKSEVREEAGKYLRLEYGKGSIVMVAARALGELENVGISMDSCLAMPELVKEEARALFLYHARSENIELDEEVVMECIRRCYFRKGDGGNSKHYLPLTLKALGSQLVGRHPSEWKLQLKEEDVFNQQREDENPVFSVLGTSFDALMCEDQMLFMDVALFDDQYWGYERNFGWINGIYEEVLQWFTIFEWLSMVHGISVDRVRKRLNELKRRSLLEELGDGSGHIGMHDLWREFAVMKAKHSEERNSKWVYERYHEDLHGIEGSVESCMSSGGWNNLRRVYIQGRSIKPLSFNECSEVKVLRLVNFIAESGVLDLSHLKSIRSLEIGQWIFNTWPVVNGGVDVMIGIGQLLNLRILTWRNIDLRLVSAVEEISCLTKLRVLDLSLYEDIFPGNYLSLDLQQLRYLQDVRVYLPNMVSISGFNSNMKELRILVLVGCLALTSCEGVGDVKSLEVLLLNECSSLQELPNLQKLTRLRRLDVSGCELLEDLPGLGSLVALQELRARKGMRMLTAMVELPCMSNLAKLEILDLSGCYELRCIQGLGNLVALRELVIRSRCMQGLPNLRTLLKLRKVDISNRKHMYETPSDSELDSDSEPDNDSELDSDSEPGYQVSQRVLNLAMLESIPALFIHGLDGALTNLCELTALKSLELWDCKFESLPHMGRDMRLESLKLVRCSRLRGLDGVRGLRQGLDYQVDLCNDRPLSNLKKLNVKSCDVLAVIDLSHFPQLRNLSYKGSCWTGGSMTLSPRRSYQTNPGFVLHCHAIHLHLVTMSISSVNIEELPDLQKFPRLQSIWIERCHNLMSLTISEPLVALSSVWLYHCKEMRIIPNINLFPRLTQFVVYDCGVELNEHEVQILEARGFQDLGYFGGGKYWLLPSRNIALLSTMDLACSADEEVVVDAINDLDAPLEPCTNEFIPYDEFLLEFGRSGVPKRAVELGSASGSNEEQTKKPKNVELLNLFL